MKGTLQQGYQTDVDTATDDSWADALSRFDDAFLHQTWAYGSVRWGESNMSSFLLRKGQEIVAAARVRLLRIPFLGRGIAYVRWGPVWQLRGEQADPEVFRQALRGLKEEYVKRRRLLLRLVRHDREEPGGIVQTILEEEDFRRNEAVPPERTILIDLRRSTEEIRKGLSKNWRRRLTLAERNPIETVEGDSLDLYDIYRKLDDELMGLKHFVQYTDPEEYRKIQEALPSRQKMGILICKHENRPVAGVVWSGIGNTSLEILIATNAEGRELGAAYYLKWRELMCLKDHGFQWHDLAGINPVRNPGGFQFKTGVLGKEGKNGLDIQRLGQYDAYVGVVDKMAVRLADTLRLRYRSLRERMARGRPSIEPADTKGDG